jgi:hypothetical protein
MQDEKEKDCDILSQKFSIFLKNFFKFQISYLLDPLTKLNNFNVIENENQRTTNVL